MSSTQDAEWNPTVNAFEERNEERKLPFSMSAESALIWPCKFLLLQMKSINRAKLNGVCAISTANGIFIYIWANKLITAAIN